MNLQRIKSVKDVKLTDIVIDITKHDTTFKAIRFTDKEGHVVEVSGYYGMDICVPAPPTTEKKWHLIVTAYGQNVTYLCDSRYEAEEMQRKWKSTELPTSDFSYKIEEVEVLVED